MKRILVCSVFAAALMTRTATAADFPRSYPAPAPYTAFSWAGANFGANLGYQWGSVANAGADPNGEVNLCALKFSMPWSGTLRGRAGCAVNNMLFYGTGGLAYGSGRIETIGATETHSHFGWTAGVGMEVGLAPNWSAKVFMSRSTTWARISKPRRPPPSIIWPASLWPTSST